MSLPLTCPSLKNPFKFARPDEREIHTAILQLGKKNYSSSRLLVQHHAILVLGKEGNVDSATCQIGFNNLACL
jgi:hypothetical protein